MITEQVRAGAPLRKTAELDEARRELELANAHSRGLEALLLALRESASQDELWPRLLGVFLSSAGASAASIWLDDGQGALGAAAVLGAPHEGLTSVSVSHTDAFGDEAVTTLAGKAWALSTDHPLCRGLAGEAGATWCLPLLDRETLIGAVCLELPPAAELDPLKREKLGALASVAASVVAEQLLEDQLTHSLRARDEVLGIVAHDLRNPLNVIAAASSSLHQRLPDLLSRRPVERIMRAAQRAEHLIRDLLDINAIESGRFSIEKISIDSTKLILSAVESQQSLAASSSVILASDLSPELPPIEADEERVLEVLENLLGNALKFTEAGGTATIGATARSDELLIWVKDNGPGMPAEHVSRLFDRFWQGRPGDRRGAGLGLTICRAIVEAHGGRIWAESTLGEGTTVFFTVPTQTRLRRWEDQPAASILIVDDRPENLLSLRAILDRPDYRLVTASSGEDALSLALRETFAVALIDIAMPGMDGLEVAIHLKELERSRDIPIIFITAFGDDPEEIHRAYSAGGADYLVKPLDAEIVRKKVAVFVDLSRRRDSHARRANLAGEE